MKYDRKTARYRDEKGRFVSQQAVRRQIEGVVDKVGRQSRDLKVASDWKKNMRQQIKTLHTLSAAVGKGGRKQMSQSDWGKVGAAIKKEYQYLDKFEKDLKHLSPKQISYRSSLYARSARNVFALMQKEANKEAGKILSRRILHASESCSECLFWAGKGFVENQPPIGSLQCKSNCRCEVEYK